eukprot:jgi/Ulvmu1/8131/UM040_0027.1
MAPSCRPIVMSSSYVYNPMLFTILWAMLLGSVCVYGQAVVRSASELALAIRRQESLISIESRITGTILERSARIRGFYAPDPERYKEFPEVPEECLADPGPCLADPAYVTVAVPTTITSSTNSLWDLGFLRRRLLVAQNITLDSICLQGAVSDVLPFVFFFLFTADASLACRNCTVEHSCGGDDASFFLADMGLASLSQTIKQSEDGMSVTGTVTLRAAQDVTDGTRSSQTFENGTFRCNHDLLCGVMLDTTVRPEDTCQLESDDGHSYRGTKNTTRSGYTCQRWDATQPNHHNRLPSAFPGAGLVDNYCRNPDNEAELWCYTVNGPRWEACGVPLCAVEEEDEAGVGGAGDPRTAMLAGSLVVVAALAATGAVVLLLHRRQRWRRSAQHTLNKASSHTKRVMYGGSHSGATEAAAGDASCGLESSRKAVAIVNSGLEGSADPGTGDPGTGDPADASALVLPMVRVATEEPWEWQRWTSGSSSSGAGPVGKKKKVMVDRWMEVATGVRSSGTHTEGQTAGTVDGSLPSVWTALALSADSPPAQLLEAQLEWLSYHGDGRLLEYLRLVPHLGLRAGGQGAVAFAQHQNAASRLFALKFFCSDVAFEVEKQASMLPELRALMPPVEVVEQRPEELAAVTARMPWPLCARPLPPVIATEKGESLDDFVRRSAPDYFTSLQVMVHIAEKLQQLHAAGWAHRDLKPSNAIWLPSKNSWTLIDFGCAARIGEEAPLLFSLYYAPPEVVQAYDGGRKTTLCAAAADVWALGVICWELLTKQRFYGAGARSHDVIAQLCGRAALPTEGTICSDFRRRLGCSRLCASILAMLSRAPDHRPSVGELLHQWKSVFGEPDIA